MPRGRQIGQHGNPRDKRGWMVPRAGTMRRRVYDLLVLGKRNKEAYEALGISYEAYRKHRRFIEKTDHWNSIQYQSRLRELARW